MVLLQKRRRRGGGRTENGGGSPQAGPRLFLREAGRGDGPKTQGPAPKGEERKARRTKLLALPFGLASRLFAAPLADRAQRQRSAGDRAGGSLLAAHNPAPESSCSAQPRARKPLLRTTSSYRNDRFPRRARRPAHTGAQRRIDAADKCGRVGALTGRSEARLANGKGHQSVHGFH